MSMNMYVYRVTENQNSGRSGEPGEPFEAFNLSEAKRISRGGKRLRGAASLHGSLRRILSGHLKIGQWEGPGWRCSTAFEPGWAAPVTHSVCFYPYTYSLPNEHGRIVLCFDTEPSLSL